MIIVQTLRSSRGNELSLKDESGECLTISKADAKKLGLYELTESDLPMRFDDDDLLDFLAYKLKAVKYCTYLLGFSDKSERILRKKLWEKEYPPEIIEEALTVLRDGGIINDDNLCLRKMLSIANTKLFGPYRLKSELMAKGFSAQSIRTAEEQADIDFDVLLDELLEKLLASGNTDLTDTASLVKLKAKLSRYGYGYEQINSRLNAYCDSQNNYDSL